MLPGGGDNLNRLRRRRANVLRADLKASFMIFPHFLGVSSPSEHTRSQGSRCHLEINFPFRFICNLGFLLTTLSGENEKAHLPPPSGPTWPRRLFPHHRWKITVKNSAHVRAQSSTSNAPLNPSRHPL